jgi:magnesium transporter
LLRYYIAGAEGARSFEPGADPAALTSAVWIDLADPLPFEIEAVQAATGLTLPTRDSLVEIEASSRTYQEAGVSFMTATAVVGLDSDTPGSVPLGFVLTPTQLVTLRYADPHSFRLMTSYCERTPLGDNPLPVLLKLLDLIVDRVADILERMSEEIDTTSQLVFGRDTPANRRITSDDLRTILRRIGDTHFVVNKVHDSLHTLQKIVGFLNLPPEAEPAEPLAARRAKLDKRSREELKSLARDIVSLVENATYLSANIGFLLEASVGRISIEQNAIIKIFSVAAVVFLPPTLVASIYGMNFAHMPELEWMLGYPMALLLMVMSAVLPYLWFKKKGWL